MSGAVDGIGVNVRCFTFSNESFDYVMRDKVQFSTLKGSFMRGLVQRLQKNNIAAGDQERLNSLTKGNGTPDDAVWCNMAGLPSNAYYPCLPMLKSEVIVEKNDTVMCLAAKDYDVQVAVFHAESDSEGGKQQLTWLAIECENPFRATEVMNILTPELQPLEPPLSLQGVVQGDQGQDVAMSV